MPLLNTADKLYLGTQTVTAMYLGTTKVWPPFNPKNLSGLKVWLDASQIPSAAPELPISSWPNLAIGGAPGAMMGTPLPWISDRQLNSKPLVRFFNNSGRMRMTSTGVGTDYTLVYLARLVAGGVAGRVVTVTYPPSNFLVGFWNGYQDVGYDNGFTTPDTRTSVVYDQWKLYSADGATSGSYRLFSNGNLLGSTPVTGGWNGTLNISGYDASSTAETCDIEMAELVLYDNKKTDAERQQVEGYLRAKWGV